MNAPDHEPRYLVPALIGLSVALALATVVFALLGIWNSDGRWGWTALVSGALLLLALMVGEIVDDERQRYP